MIDPDASFHETFIQSLRSEAQRLRAILQHTPAYRRLMIVEEAISLYLETEDAERAPSQTAQKVPRTGTIAASVVDITGKYLQKINRRAQTPEIAEQVQANGVLVGAANVIAAVSSYLSQAKDRFDNVRGEGYGLIEWSTKAPDRTRAGGILSKIDHAFGNDRELKEMVGGETDTEMVMVSAAHDVDQPQG